MNHEFQDDGEGGELKLFRNASLEKRKKIVLAWRATAAELFLQQAPTEKKWWDEHKDKMVSNGEATGELETTLTMFAKQIHAPGASLDQLNLQYLAHVLNVNLVIVVCALAGGAALGSPTNVDLRVHAFLESTTNNTIVVSARFGGLGGHYESVVQKTDGSHLCGVFDKDSKLIQALLKFQ